LWEAFIRWRRDHRLRIGGQLSTTWTRVPTITTAANHPDGGGGSAAGEGTGSHPSQPSGSTLVASTMVARFSHAKLPLSISHPCVTPIATPAQPAIGCGAKRSQGITSCVRWFAATSTR
jgi:hypothetical protein